MRKSARPRVISSKCIEFAACRYNGAMIPSAVVQLLKPHVDFSPVCPEVEIGLGIPRNPVRMVKTAKGLRLLQPDTGLDLTAKMQRFVRMFLDSVSDIDGFILKFRSPSCGMKDVKIYSASAKAAPLSKGAGLFGGAVIDRFGGLAVEDEGRLKNYRIREHFLSNLFTLAAFREVKTARAMREVVRFHTDNKLLLMARPKRETLGVCTCPHLRAISRGEYMSDTPGSLFQYSPLPRSSCLRSWCRAQQQALPERFPCKEIAR